MAYQDRGYFRGAGSRGGGDWSAVGTIIAVNVAVWLANFILAGDLVREIFPLRVSLNDIFCLESDLPSRPWNAWQLLTYGFLHDGPSLEFPGFYTPWHLVFNMIALWFFGRDVEGVMGRAEFLRFWCVAIVVAGLAWVAAAQFGGPAGRLVGASGGVMAVLAMFVWYFPQTTVLVWGVLPVPAWALGVLYFVSDLQGAASGGGNVAHIAHLAGAVFGLVYAWRGLDLGTLAEWPRRLFRSGRKLRVVRPEEGSAAGDHGDDPETPQSLQEEVDRILAKISRSGASSLTVRERETLERASRRLKDRERAR